MIKAVLFDFHNTLVASDRWFALEIRTIVSEALRRLAERGLAEYSDELAQRAEEIYRDMRLEVHETAREVDAVDGVDFVMRKLGYSIPREHLVEIVDSLQRECLPDASLCDGVHSAIDTLQKRGVQIGIVSSAVYTPFLHWALDKFGIGSRFGTVVTSASCGHYKSSPEIFLQAVRDLGVKPEEALHVGDSYRFDVLGAKRAGLKAVWLRLPGQSETHGPDADAVIERIDEIPGCLDFFHRGRS